MRTIVLVCTLFAAAACGGNSEEKAEADISAINQPDEVHSDTSTVADSASNQDNDDSTASQGSDTVQHDNASSDDITPVADTTANQNDNESVSQEGNDESSPAVNGNDPQDDTNVIPLMPVLPNETLFFDFQGQGIPEVTSPSALTRVKGSEGCNGWGEDYDKFCDANTGERLFLAYMKAYSSDHMGYLRYGAMSGETMTHAAEGDALAITLTGGQRHDKDGVLRTEGDEVQSLAMFQQQQDNASPTLYSNHVLPGWSMLINGMSSTTQPLPHFQHANRFSFWVWYPKDKKRHVRHNRWDREVNAPARTINWHPFIDDSRGGHYYHQVANRAYGGWIKVVFDANPTHHNAGVHSQFMHLPYGGHEAEGDGLDYFRRITMSQVVFYHTKYQSSPYHFLTDRWISSKVDEENDETIASLAVGYDDERQRFDISFEDKYRCGECHGNYEVTYSFSPITNQNVINTHAIKDIENFFTDHDDEPMIVKPNAGYNQVWASFAVAAEDLNRFKAGEPIYFAVRDRSERTFAYEARDDELITLADGSQKSRRHLVKTLRYQYRVPPRYPRIKGIKDVAVSPQAEGSVTLTIADMPTDVTFRATSVAAVDVDIVQQSESVMVNLNGGTVGEHYISVEAVSQHRVVARHLLRLYVPAQSCATQGNCNHYVLADFTQAENNTPTASWSQLLESSSIAKDSFGASTVIGSNPSYHHVGVKGDEYQLLNDDVVQITIYNRADYPIDVAPNVSFSQTSFDSQADDWHRLRAQQIPAKASRSWFIPKSWIAQESINVININLPNDVRSLAIQNISLLTQG